METVNVVTFYSPGTFVSETSDVPIDSWDIEKAKELARGIKERHNATPYGFRFRKRTLKVITDRKQWIEARTAQIEELKKLQVKLVKMYDSGKLDARAYDKLVAEITAVENDKASDSHY